jgi:hypothetical protein
MDLMFDTANSTTEDSQMKVSQSVNYHNTQASIHQEAVENADKKEYQHPFIEHKPVRKTIICLSDSFSRELLTYDDDIVKNLH